MNQQDDDPRQPAPSLLVRAIREPLLHFVLLAALLLAANALWAEPERQTILVTAPMVEELEARQRDLLGRPLTEAERRDVLESYVEEEVLVREARRLGFDNDSRTRRHLAMKMRFFLDEDRPMPTTEQLRDLYEREPDRYAVPDRRTLQVVTLADGASPEQTLGLLRGNGPRELGLDVRSLPRHSAYDVRMAYDQEFSVAAFAIEDDAWHGPIPSPRGVHLVRIVQRFDSYRQPFEEIEAFLRQEWDFDERRRVVSEKTAEILENYDVVIESDPSPEESP